jgi:4-carboxymuconolactone decarboxylase
MIYGLNHKSGSVMPIDRMPPLAPEQMNEQQKKYAEEIIKGPRGALYGPFIPLIRSPELMDRAQRVGEYLRYNSAIGNRLSEFAILITSRQWTQQVEWAIHAPIALAAGIHERHIEAIANGKEPTGMSDEENIVYCFCMELHQTKKVSDETYQRAVKTFGEKGVMDLIGINGYYTFLAMVMNTTCTPVPDGKPDTLPQLK